MKLRCLFCWLLPATGLGLCCALMLGCGPGTDAPRLSNLRCLLGPDHCQRETDPFTLELLVEIDDPDADLSGGTLRRYLEGKQSGDSELLKGILRSSGLTAGLGSGTLSVAFPLDLVDIHDGLTLQVGLQVMDEGGHESNRPGLDLRLQIQ